MIIKYKTVWINWLAGKIVDIKSLPTFGTESSFVSYAIRIKNSREDTLILLEEVAWYTVITLTCKLVIG
jgi:hypothetical protein